MIFHTLDVSKLVAFKHANIERLELEFHSPCHIVLGTNGCGKSSLLRELTPSPSPRSAYEIGGKKTLTLSHRGSHYTLISDYANKNSPHSFEKNDQQLNEGGTTPVQEELIRAELGYSNEVADLVTGAYDFAKMTPGLRRTLLITLNPWQLEFVLNHHKKVGSAIRAGKANLAMLQERKFLLEQDFLPETQQALLTTEREALQKEIALVVEFLHRADDRLRQIPPRKGQPFEADWAEYRKLIYKQLHTFGKYRDVPRTGRDAHEKKLLQMRSAYQERLTVLQEQQRDLIEARNADQAILAELDESELLKQTQLRDQTRQIELDALKAQSTRNPASEDSLQEWVVIGPELEQSFAAFLDCPIKLRRDEDLQKLKQIFQHWQYVFQENSLELHRLGGEVGRIEKLQTLKLADIPDEPCAKHACPLFVQFKTAHDRRLAQLDELNQRMAYLQRQNQRLTAYLHARDQFFQQQAAYLPAIRLIRRDLARLGMAEPVHFIRRLQQDPIALYRQVKDWISASEATYRYQRLLVEVETEQWKRQAQTEVASEERERIEQRVIQADAKYHDLGNRLTAGTVKIAELQLQLDLLAEYTNLLDDLNGQKQMLHDTLQHAWHNHDRQQLQQMIHDLGQKRDHAIRRLGEIDHVLQNQTNLRSRYEEEILKQITKIEAEQAEWKWMEASLAKIPLTYQVTFLNGLIAQMNHYIAKVFSYPLVLLPVSTDDPLEYRFAMQVGDTVVPDIAMGSEGQREIINVTFRFALFKQLGLSDYPIQLDEIGKNFDTYHKQRLLELLREIIDTHVVSQMHLVNHHALIHEGLTNADILVLNADNILTPPVFNQHVQFNRFD